MVRVTDLDRERAERWMVDEACADQLQEVLARVSGREVQWDVPTALLNEPRDRRELLSAASMPAVARVLDGHVAVAQTIVAQRRPVARDLGLEPRQSPQELGDG